MQSLKRLRVGIDLGTTNSSCAVIDTSEDRPQPRLLAIEQLWLDPQGPQPYRQEKLLPSVVWLTVEGRAYTGAYCKNLGKGLGQPQTRVVRSIKRQMGNPAWSLQLGQQELRAYEIAGLILATIHRSLREQWPTGHLEMVTIGIPASFSSAQRQETLRAAEYAGFDPGVVRLLDEPVAALFSMGQEELGRVKPGSRTMVFDMGGGTLDVALMTLDPTRGLISVDAVSRYNEIAGDDIDLEIAALLLKRVREEYPQSKLLDLWKSSTDESTRRRIAVGLLEQAAVFKKGLSVFFNSFDWEGSLENITGRCRQLGQRLPVRFDLNDHFESPEPATLDLPVADVFEALAPFLSEDTSRNRSIFVPIRQVKDAAGGGSPDIIYVTGGSSRFTPVTHALRRYYGARPEKLDYDFAVSMGAAYWSHATRQGLWKVAERVSERIFIKRQGKPFLEVLPPLGVPSEHETKIKADDQPYIAKAGNGVRIEFFRGVSADDPLMSLAHAERLALPRDLPAESALVVVRGRVDGNKIFHFDLVFKDSKTDELVEAVVEFQNGAAPEMNPPSTGAPLVSLNGSSIR